MELTRNRLLNQNFGMCITPQDLILPYYASIGPNYYRPWKWCLDSGIRDFGSLLEDQEEKFKITLDVQHFGPNEISVRVIEKEIIVEGKHEERQDNHGVISRQFKRRYVLPSDCLPELVSSTLSSDGILTVTAGKKSINNKAKEITVPILLCGPTPKKEQAENNINSDCNLKKNEDTINNNLNLENKIKFSSKEDYCPVKKDFTEPTIMSADKIILEARKESDNLLKMTSDVVQFNAGTALTKLENVIEQSNASMDEMIEKISEKNVMNKTETSTFNSTMKETACLASEEISSFKSSITSSMKMSGEQVSESISAELKDAAEII